MNEIEDIALMKRIVPGINDSVFKKIILEYVRKFK